jgi:hypothetical protein
MMFGDRKVVFFPSFLPFRQKKKEKNIHPDYNNNDSGDVLEEIRAVM